jgi:Putative adhesin
VTTRPIEASDINHLVVRIGSGSVKLRPNTVPGVIGELRGKRADEVTVDAQGDTLTISTPRGMFSSDCDMDLAIPEGIELSVQSGSADLIASVGLGGVRVRTGSGDVVVGHVVTFDCGTGSGDIAAEAVVGATAALNTGSGDIVIGSCDASLRVRSASGDIQVGQLRAVMQGNSASGDVEIKATSGNVNVRTASGDIRIGVAEGLPAWLDLSSASGEVSVNLGQGAEPGPGEPYVSLLARTASGDIDIIRG